MTFTMIAPTLVFSNGQTQKERWKDNTNNWRAGGQVVWRDVFPNEKCEFSAGCTEDRRAGQQAMENDGPACRKGQSHPAVQPALLCS